MVEANGDAGASGKMFSENTVAVLLMALGNTSISNAQYDMMSALDGNKTASSYQHQFRSVLKKARELKQRVDDGETFAAVTPSKKRGASDNFKTPPVTPKKPKATPKTTPKSSGKKEKAQVEKAQVEETSPTDDVEDGAAFGMGVEEMIKKEKGWEEDFA